MIHPLLDIMDELSEHLIGRVTIAIFRFKPDFIRLDIDSSFLSFLETESFDIDIFDIFFRAGFLELFVERHRVMVL